MDKVDVLGVGIARIDEARLLRHVGAALAARQPALYTYVNVNAVNIACSHPWFRDFVNSADVAYCDGEGVRFGARLLGEHLPSRIVLTYFFWDLCEQCVRNGHSMYLLGSHTAAVEAAVGRIRERHPGVRIAGTYHGYFPKTGPESDAVVAQINEARPDYLFVGFGMPLQEEWLKAHRHELNAGVIFPCGSMIDYVAGHKSYAPAWMSDHGMEWVYRLFQEPGRLWKRYLIGNPLFLLRVLRQRWTGSRP